MSAPRAVEPRKPVISLKVEIDDKRSRVLLSYGQSRDVPYDGELSTVNLSEVRKALHEGLTRFVKTIGPELSIGGTRPKRWRLEPGFIYDYRVRSYNERKWGIITDAVIVLYTQGHILADKLFGSATREVGSIFREALKTAQSQPLDRADNLPLIDVTAGVKEFIPIELLMLLKEYPQTPDKKRSPITNPLQLAEALSPFVGFAHAVVRRNTGTAPVAQTDRLPGDPRLPVKLFKHPSLWEAGGALSGMKKTHPLELDDTRPQKGSVEPGRFHYHVADHLWMNDGMRFDGSSLGRPFQVQHFACHFKAGEKTDDNSLLLGEGEDFRVSLGMLRVCRQEKDFESQKGLASPLVFLNACGSAVVDPAGVMSFPEYLMKHGSRGFIGTEALVPEEVAEAFAEAFYEEFLKPKPLGLAIQIAKRRLLENKQNPLGILYTVYANPDTTVG